MHRSRNVIPRLVPPSFPSHYHPPARPADRHNTGFGSGPPDEPKDDGGTSWGMTLRQTDGWRELDRPKRISLGVALVAKNLLT
jgi:hypothetical protein